MLAPDTLLALIAELDEGQGVALTRLAKRLDARVSVLLRELTLLSEAVVGGVPGPGWVRLACDDAGRWVVRRCREGEGGGEGEGEGVGASQPRT